MNQITHSRSTIFSLSLALFTLLYGLTVPALLLGLAGVQWVPTDIPAQQLLILVFMAIVGAIGIVGIFRWKRWGIYVLLLSWLFTLVFNALYPSVVATIISNVGVLLAFALGLGMGRSWQEFV